jgi:hypothetical protein
MHPFVHPIHHIQQRVQGQFFEIIESELAFFGSLFVAVDAIGTKNLRDLRIDFVVPRFCDQIRGEDEKNK